MITFRSEPLELRGVATRTNQAGKSYYVLNTEDDEGNPQAFYCPEKESIPLGLKKGQMIVLHCRLYRYDKQEKLVVHLVEACK